MVAGARLCEMSDGFESVARTVCSNRVALDELSVQGEVQRFLMGAAGDAMAAMRAKRAVITSAFGLTDADRVGDEVRVPGWDSG